MNILFVSQYFYPENFRINDLAISLKERGHNVSVLTGMPNYPQGKLYEGYSKNGPFYEEWNGIRIYRVNNRVRKSGSKNLVLNYLSFILKGNSGAKALIKNNNYDVIYAFGTSPITQALPAITIRKIKGIPVILNVQDLWPDNVCVITGIDNPIFVRTIDLIVDYIYNRCDIILGTSKSFVEAIKKRKGLKVKHKVKYWPQYATVTKSDNCREEFFEKDSFNIAFTGNIGQGQGLERIIDCFAYIKGKKIKLHLFGDGRAKMDLESRVKRLDLSSQVLFHGSFPESEIPDILNGADAALLCLNDSPIFEKTIPAKLQTYLCCGCPVLGVVSGEAKRIIEENNLGICCDNKIENNEEIADTILKMSQASTDEISSWRENAIKLSQAEFSKKELVDEIEKMMEVLGKK